MQPLTIYKLPDGTTRQYRRGEQPAGAAEVSVAESVAQTPEMRAATAKKRTTRKKAAPKGGAD